MALYSSDYIIATVYDADTMQTIILHMQEYFAAGYSRPTYVYLYNAYVVIIILIYGTTVG